MNEHVREDLPWYVAGTLDTAAAHRVGEHLAQCADCRGEFAMETQLANAIREARVVDLAPQAALARLMTRLDAREARRTVFNRLLQPWTGVRAHRSLVLATAIQAAAIVLLTGILAIVVTRPAAQDYRTLSNAAAVLPAATPRLRVVFDEQLTTGEIRALLEHVEGRIVGGPAANGIFTIAVSREAEDAARWLRTHPGVRLAEVVAE